MANLSVETFVHTRNTAYSSVVGKRGVIAQASLIARYFVEDLDRLIREANIHLAEMLGLPLEYDNQEVIEMLFEDISHLLGDELISGIHLLLSDPQIDPNTNSYPVRYHVYYTTATSLSPPSTSHPYVRSFAKLLPEIWQGARFDLLVDWNPSTSHLQHHARRPAYIFDWVPEQAPFNATTLVRYRNSYLAVDGASTIERLESASPSQVALDPQLDFSGREDVRTEDLPFSFYALVQIALEDDDKALVGKTYFAQAGVSRNEREGFSGEKVDPLSHNVNVPLPFDLLLHTSENISLTTDWHKKLFYDPYESQPQLVDFGLQIVGAGRSYLSIDFYRQRRWLRTVRVEFESVEPVGFPNSVGEEK